MDLFVFDFTQAICWNWRKQIKTFMVSSDEPAGIDALLSLFADHLKLFRKMTPPIDAFTFQRAFDQLYKRCVLNRLHLKLKKCIEELDISAMSIQSEQVWKSQSAEGSG